MRRSRALATAALCVAAVVDAPAQSKDEIMGGIRADCAAQWPTDYSMRVYCVNQQVEAVNRVGQLVKHGKDSVETQIVARCMGEWRSAGGYDWAMVVYCSEQQIDAYRQLNP